jgi:N-acetylglucosaminyl-diphospho-decaprenol L-rhamnosyltransferase
VSGAVPMVWRPGIEVRSGMLSVVIVTWNVRELVLRCLAALQRESAELDMEIIVVDNASADGTVDALRGTYPDVRVLANRENIGFPIANNQGVAAARGDVVLFLNPDTEVRPGALRACMDCLAADAGVGVVGCQLVLEDGSVQFECARRTYRLQHLVMEILYLHMLLPRTRICGDHLMSYWDHEGERDVEAISGAFMMARRSVVEQVGGLPDDVFMYHEDLAFCLAARRAGWRIRYLGGHQVLHRWKGSSRKAGSALALLEGESKIRLIRDAQGDAAAIAGRLVYAVRSGSRILPAALGSLILGRTPLAERFPRLFDWRTHSLQFTWAVAPFLVARRIPRPVQRPAPAVSGASE